MNPQDDPNRRRGDPLDSPEAARLRALFRRSTPHGNPVDLERLLTTAAQRKRGWHGAFGRRRMAAAALLLFCGAGCGWFLAWQEMKQEVALMHGSMGAQLRELRMEVVGELSRALDEYGKNLLEAQEDGMKKVALLLRNDYRPRLARLRSKVQGLAFAVEHAAFRSPPPNRSR